MSPWQGWVSHTLPTSLLGGVSLLFFRELSSNGRVLPHSFRGFLTVGARTFWEAVGGG